MRMWLYVQLEIQLDQAYEELQGQADLRDSTIFGAHISDVHLVRSANPTSNRCQTTYFDQQTQPCEH